MLPRLGALSLVISGDLLWFNSSLNLVGGKKNTAFDYLLKAQVAAFELQGVYSVGEEMEIKTWWQDGVRPVGQWLSTELG